MFIWLYLLLVFSLLLCGHKFVVLYFMLGIEVRDPLFSCIHNLYITTGVLPKFSSKIPPLNALVRSYTQWKGLESKKEKGIVRQSSHRMIPVYK